MAGEDSLSIFFYQSLGFEKSEHTLPHCLRVFPSPPSENLSIPVTSVSHSAKPFSLFRAFKFICSLPVLNNQQYRNGKLAFIDTTNLNIVVVFIEISVQGNKALPAPIWAIWVVSFPTVHLDPQPIERHAYLDRF